MNDYNLKRHMFDFDMRQVDNIESDGTEDARRKDVAGGIVMVVSLLISLYIVLTLVLDAAKFVIVRVQFLVPVIFLLNTYPAHAEGGVSGAIGAFISAMQGTTTSPDAPSTADDDDD